MFRWEKEKEGGELIFQLFKRDACVATIYAPAERDENGYLDGAEIVLSLLWCRINLRQLVEQIIDAPGLAQEDRAIFLGIQKQLKFLAFVPHEDPREEQALYCNVLRYEDGLRSLTPLAEHSTTVQ